MSENRTKNRRERSLLFYSQLIWFKQILSVKERKRKRKITFCRTDVELHRPDAGQSNHTEGMFRELLGERKREGEREREQEREIAEMFQLREC